MAVAPKIAVVVLTHNRRHLLEQCITHVLGRTSEHTGEILVWDNGSDDDTAEFLATVTDPRFRVVRHEENIGLNAYDPAIRLTRAPMIVALDEDVVDAPPRWDEALLDAFGKLPSVGFLVANLAENPDDRTTSIMYGSNAPLYRVVERNGVRLKVGGPVGGWCAMTSRELYDAVGGIGRRRFTYWYWDGAYISKLAKSGYEAAFLNDLQVRHSGGPVYSSDSPQKLEFWRAQERRVRRRRAVKRVLSRIPPVRRLNERHHWFVFP